jgi:hypothetical protein
MITARAWMPWADMIEGTVYRLYTDAGVVLAVRRGESVRFMGFGCGMQLDVSRDDWDGRVADDAGRG